MVDVTAHLLFSFFADRALYILVQTLLKYCRLHCVSILILCCQPSTTNVVAEPVAVQSTVEAVAAEPPQPKLSTCVSAEAVQTALENVNAQAQAQAQIDNEVSQISFNKAKEEALAQAASGQVCL